METVPGIREAPPVRDTPGLWALVLAAGAGSRFGGDKLKAPWGEVTLIQAAVAAAKAAPVRGVILLVRPGDRLVEDFGVRVVEVADWAEGMGATLRAGVAALPEDCTGAYVFLGDMPRVPCSAPVGLAEALARGALAAAPVFGGRQGHPVLFSSALFPDLLKLVGDRGARALLDGLGARLTLVKAEDDGVLFDVDRLSDLGAGNPRPPGCAAGAAHPRAGSSTR